MQPYEIIDGPLELYLAPIGTAFPLIGVAPAIAWVKVGASGKRNYANDGVAVQHGQTLAGVSPAGALGDVKVFRQSEMLQFSVTLWDQTLEAYTLALGGVAPAATAAGVGTAGYKKIGLSRGETVKTYALLARGKSPYADGMMAQFEVPRCYQSGNPNPIFNKAVPAGLALQWSALEDLAAASEDERFGRLISQTAAPLP